jgi:hypothetical protein
MPIIYEVTVESTERENLFNITWRNAGTGEAYSFDRAAEITRDEVERQWQILRHQLPVGQKLFRFLDGDEHYFRQVLAQAYKKGEHLQIHLRTCSQTADWPFELLAQDDTFLLPDRVHLIRRVSDFGVDKKIPPRDGQLKLLFMSCSAMNGGPELDFESEEEAIYKITGDLAIDMDVEDSGSLEGLRSKLVQERFDIVHLSGHADIDEKGQPYFIMEDDTGHKDKVFAVRLYGDALIENPPRLVFLSGCRTGETPEAPDTPHATEHSAAVSFARLLAEKRNVPAVLGWGRSVTDDQAAYAGKIFLREISRGQSILDAVKRTRFELLEHFEMVANPAWPLLRLYSTGIPLNAIVTENQQWQPKIGTMKHVYLHNSEVQVLVEGFVGRRRQLQAGLKGLKKDIYKVGLLLLGAGGLGKSCLAGKICERFDHYTLIILHGKLDSTAIKEALTDAFIKTQDEKGRQILTRDKSMALKLADLCATSFKEKNYLLLLDDFEQNLENVGKGRPGPLTPEAADLLISLLYYLPNSGKMTQLIITSRYLFSLTKRGQDMVDRLEKVWLTSFQDAALRKKKRELENIINYKDQTMVPYLVSESHGNPLLMEQLDRLVEGMPAKEPTELFEIIKLEKEKFIREYLVREVLRQSSEKLILLLRWLSIYQRPVLEEGVKKVAQKAGLEQWQSPLAEGMGLSLIEHDQTHNSYLVTPLLRKELLETLENKKAAHEAAFDYYSEICKAKNSIDPVLYEEWIAHAEDCGKGDIASQQAGQLVNYLRKRQDLQESRRVGEWILEKKNRSPSSADDIFLVRSLEATLKLLEK